MKIYIFITFLILYSSFAFSQMIDNNIKHKLQFEIIKRSLEGLYIEDGFREVINIENRFYKDDSIKKMRTEKYFSVHDIRDTAINYYILNYQSEISQEIIFELWENIQIDSLEIVKVYYPKYNSFELYFFNKNNKTILSCSDRPKIQEWITNLSYLDQSLLIMTLCLPITKLSLLPKDTLYYNSLNPFFCNLFDNKMLNYEIRERRDSLHDELVKKSIKVKNNNIEIFFIEKDYNHIPSPTSFGSLTMKVDYILTKVVFRYKENTVGPSIIKFAKKGNLGHYYFKSRGGSITPIYEVVKSINYFEPFSISSRSDLKYKEGGLIYLNILTKDSSNTAVTVNIRLGKKSIPFYTQSFFLQPNSYCTISDANAVISFGASRRKRHLYFSIEQSDKNVKIGLCGNIYTFWR